MKVMSQEWIDKARAAYKIQQERKELERKEKIMLDELKALQEHQSAHGGGFAFVCNTKQGSIDYQAIVAERLPEVNTELYRKPETQAWKMSLELVEQ